MKPSFCIYVLLVPIAFWWHGWGTKKSKARHYGVSIEVLKGGVKKNAIKETSIANYPPKELPAAKKRRGKGTEKTPFLISTITCSVKPFTENYSTLYTTLYYYYHLHSANGKRGPPSDYLTT